MADEEREAAILARCEAATKGPWAWASTGEKCYGANVGAGCFAEADNDCETPLTGDLSGREDDYFVEQGVAEMEHQNCNSDAAFIAHAREDVPWLLAQLTTLRARAERAEGALVKLALPVEAFWADEPSRVYMAPTLRTMVEDALHETRRALAARGE